MRSYPPTDRIYIDAKAETSEEKSRALLAEMRSEMHKNTSDTIKWMVGLTITSMATCISVMAFMLSNVSTEIGNINSRLDAMIKAQSAAPPVAPPAPIIIQLPPYPTAPTAPPAPKP